MKNQINTSEGNVQFITPDGKLMNVHPSHVYAVFNQDTVSFLLIAMPKSSGLAVFTSTAEDLLFNGETYTFEQLKTVIPEAFAIAGAQARAEIVDELPETGMTNTIYLVPKEEGEGYDEYIYLKDEQRWELIGDTSIEMKNYLKKVDFNSYSAATEIVINSISGAVDTEISNREAADTVISGAVDTLSTNLANEVSRAQNAETELSNKIDAVSGNAITSGEVQTMIDESISGKADADSVYTKSEVYTKAEVDDMSEVTAQAINELTINKLDASAYTPTDLSNYYTKSETSGATELSSAFAAKQNVLTAGENIVISGDVISAEAGNDVTELTQAEYDALVEAGTVDPDVLYIITDAAPINLNNYYQKSETSSKTEIEDAISAEATARANADTALSGAVDTALLGYINGAEYVSTAKTINFLHGETVIDSIDATDFIKDGMVSNVEISGGSLVIEFNTDAGKEDIVIPLTDIFDPSNYYDKTAVDGIVSGKANSSDVYLKTETSGKTELSSAFDAKLDTTAYTPTDLSNYYTKSETSGKSEISTALAAKLDTTAYTPTDLSNYYQKSETSGATELSTALDEKVNITDNYVSALTDFKVALKLGYDYTSDNISTFYLRRSYASNGKGALAYITTTDTNYPSITISGEWNNNGIAVIYATNGITSTVTNGVAQITLTGGSLVTVDATASGGGAFIYKQYSSGQTADVVEGAVYDALEELSNTKLDYFYGNETINGAKTFLWGGTSGKPIVFKQANDNAKIGFTCQNSASTNNEIATFEFRPNTFTIDGVKHPLLYFGHYRNTNTATAGVPQTVIGFRQYDQANAAAYHMLAPLPEKAKTPFSLTTAFQDFYMPMGFKNGSTMVKADETGVVDLSSIITGGKAVSGGTNISITTGETADTINCTLPMSTDSVKKIVVDSNYSSFVTSDAVITANSLSNSILLGNNTFNIKGISKGRINNNLIIGSYNTSTITNGVSPILDGSLVVGSNNNINGSYSLLVGNNNTISRNYQFAVGYKQKPNNEFETSLGQFNASSKASDTFGDSGNTLFSVGNGTADNARHNAFEIRQNGDIYITSGGTDIKLQDNLGGGSSINVVQTTGSSSADVMSQDAVTTALSGKQDSLSNASTLSGISSSDVTSWDGAATNASTAITNLGGLKLQQVTQAEYDALATKDASTLYVIVG